MHGSPSHTSAATTGPPEPDQLGIGRLLWQGRDAVVVLAVPSRRIVLWNPAATALLGYTAEAATRLRLSALVSGRYLPVAVREALSGATRDGEDDAADALPPVRLALRHAWGGERLMDVTFIRTGAAGNRFVAAVIHDRSTTTMGEDERAAYLSTLLAVAQSLSSTLDLRPLLDAILQELRHVADYTGATVTRRDGAHLVVLANRAGAPGGPSLGADLEGRRIPIARGTAIWEKLRRGKPVRIRDMQDDTPLTRAYRAVVGQQLGPRLQKIRSWLAVPLIFRGEVTGFIALSHGTPGFYTARHARFAAALANHAAAAIENARLYEQTQEAVRRATALARIAASVALGGPLEGVLDGLAASVVQASGAVACAVLLASGPSTRLRISGSSGLPAGYVAAYNQISGEDESSDNLAVLRKRRVRVRRNVWPRLLRLPLYRPIHAYAGQVKWSSIVLAPLVTRERALGTLATYYRAGEEPDKREIAFLAAIADQATVAIENARLFLAEGEKAALEERTRLAHELHDSVTQTIFSVGMLARAAQAQHEQHSAQLGGTLDRVATLAGDALVEMRGLLFELRPASLAEEGLVRSLARLVEVVQTRSSMVISYQAPETVRFGPDVELAVFRIVQEALGNATKHARAGEAAVVLELDAAGARVTVSDNGSGFDPTAPVAPSADGTRGGQGLLSMRERAAAAGLHLQVESTPGRGTRVLLQLPEGAMRPETAVS